MEQKHAAKIGIEGNPELLAFLQDLTGNTNIAPQIKELTIGEISILQKKKQEYIVVRDKFITDFKNVPVPADFITAIAPTSSVGLAVAGGSLSATVLPAGVDHNSLLNYVADKHIAHSGVSISTAVGSGLTGGGDITATRTLTVVPGDISHGALAGLGADNHAQYVLFAGRSGGQTLIGGTGTTDDLILRSTSGVGTTGADIIFQVGNNGATEAMRILNDGKVGIGIDAPTEELHLSKNQNAGTIIRISNTTAGTGAYSAFSITTDVGAGTGGLNFQVLSSSFTQSGLLIPASARFRTDSGLTNGLLIITGAAAPIIFATNDTERFRILGTGQIQAINSQLPIDTGADSVLYIRPGTDFGAGFSGSAIDPLNDAGAVRKMMVIAGSPIVFTAGDVGIRVTSPTARLHLPAGTATANTAPLKFNSGPVMTNPEPLAVEALTDNLHFTITTGAARKGIMLDDGTRLTSGKIPIATTNGRLIDGQTPLAGTKIYYVADTSGGAVTRKLTFIDGILTAEI